MDKLIEEGGETTITNDGATVMKKLQVIHPAARILVDISQAQDNEVGDGTTSVVVLAGELLKEAKSFLEDGLVAPQIIKGRRLGAARCVNSSATIDSLSEARTHEVVVSCKLLELEFGRSLYLQPKLDIEVVVVFDIWKPSSDIAGHGPFGIVLELTGSALERSDGSAPFMHLARTL